MGPWYEWETVNDLDEPSAHISGGPDRIETDDKPDPNWRPRPVGFVRASESSQEVDPLLWEGDYA